MSSAVQNHANSHDLCFECVDVFCNTKPHKPNSHHLHFWCVEVFCSTKPHKSSFHSLHFQCVNQNVFLQYKSRGCKSHENPVPIYISWDTSMKCVFTSCYWAVWGCAVRKKRAGGDRWSATKWVWKTNKTTTAALQQGRHQKSGVTIKVSPKLCHKNATTNPFLPKCFWPSKVGRWEPYPASLSFLVELGLVLLDLLVHLLHPQLHKVGRVCVELHAVLPVLPEQTHTHT